LNALSDHLNSLTTLHFANVKNVSQSQPKTAGIPLEIVGLAYALGEA
jgi:hypothetical protein